MSSCGSVQQLTGDSKKKFTYDGGDGVNMVNPKKAVYNINTVDMIDDVSIRDILSAVPGSYDDFVNSTAECMNQDEGLKNLIVKLLINEPESNSSDILKVMCNYYGFNRPLELVDDDDEDDFYAGAVETATGANGMARLARI